MTLSFLISQFFPKVTVILLAIFFATCLSLRIGRKYGQLPGNLVFVMLFIAFYLFTLFVREMVLDAVDIIVKFLAIYTLNLHWLG